MMLSVIIPAYNECEHIAGLVEYLKCEMSDGTGEIIVSDGGSVDNTIALAAGSGAIATSSPIKGRAGQMNHAASLARGDVYYFVHADTRPPQSFAKDIAEAIAQGYNCGSYRFRFDKNRGMLRLNSFFTRFNYLFFRGGDQSIFVTKALWQEVGSYNEDMLIMEDYDFLARIWSEGRFKLIPKDTIVSARKYDTNSWLRVQLANLKVVRMYRRGASQQAMIDAYRKALNYRKNAF